MTQLRELEQNHARFDEAGASIVVVSIEDVATAAETQRDFPGLVVVADENRELSNAVDLINRGVSPTGGDAATPTSLIVDGHGIVQALDRPARVMARPSAASLLHEIEQLR
jgi:peroxiredoxin